MARRRNHDSGQPIDLTARLGPKREHRSMDPTDRAKLDGKEAAQVARRLRRSQRIHRFQQLFFQFLVAMLLVLLLVVLGVVLYRAEIVGGS